jgi:hypothetical protein
MSTADPIENDEDLDDTGVWSEDDEYIFHVDVPGLTILEIPDEGIVAEIDYDRHDHALLVQLLTTLDARVDNGVDDPVRGTTIYHAVSQEDTHAQG